MSWSGFTPGAWPGVTIEAIYPVIYVSAFQGGLAADIWMSINESAYVDSPTISGTGQLSVGSALDSMGNTKSVITSATIGVPIDNTALSEDPDGNAVVVTYVGLAVYVTLGAGSLGNMWVNVR